MGVSSMMKSTPVRFSSARMLRPSRPMMRPFMSSVGSWTTETVVSAAWLAARRCMATERIERTRRSASRLVSSSTSRRICADVVARLVLDLLQQRLLGLAGAQAGDALRARACSSRSRPAPPPARRGARRSPRGCVRACPGPPRADRASAPASVSARRPAPPRWPPRARRGVDGRGARRARRFAVASPPRP